MFDTAGMFAAGTPTRLTIQQEGLYLVAGSGSFVNNVTGDRQAILRLNGTTTIANMTTPTAGTLFWSGAGVSVRSFAVGDFVELTLKQTSGGALDSADCFLSALSFGTL